MASFTDLYPERRGGVISPTTMQVQREMLSSSLTFLLQRLTGTDKVQHLKVTCEQNLVSNIEKMPMVKTLLSALKASGCPVDLKRHLVCEMCQPGSDVQHAGGYDPALNQVFVCCNNATNAGLVHGALVRNLIQMFDCCVNKYDFNNVRHLACSEVRKANLANCQFLTNLTRPEASFGVSQQHRSCVRSVAIEALVKTKFVKEEAAGKVVDEVFDKCYADLEPIGRRARNADDIKRAEDEKFLFGYS